MEQVYTINWFIELNHTNGSHDEQHLALDTPHIKAAGSMKHLTNPDQQTVLDCTLSLMAINPIPGCPSQVVSCWGRYLPVLWGTFHGIEHLVHHDSTLQTLHIIQQGHLPALTDIIISNCGILALGFTCIYMIMDCICTVHAIPIRSYPHHHYTLHIWTPISMSLRGSDSLWLGVFFVLWGTRVVRDICTYIKRVTITIVFDQGGDHVEHCW